MNEYIARDSVLTVLDWDCASRDALNAIKSIPAADVVEVVRGKWLPSDIPDSILDKCSECGFDTGAFTFHYCPNCGAKMDGGMDNG